MILPLLIFVGAYALFALPYAYFRHDDWLILRNAALLPSQWRSLWSPTLLFAEGEKTWFFRPFFKLGTYALYSAFGFRYWAWLAVMLLLMTASLWLGGDLIRRLTGDSRRSRWFVILYVGSAPLHFGSLVWIGEALMNCPEVFGLTLSLWLFFRGALDRSARRPAYLFGALLAYTLTLGFKEAAVFHSAFLLGLVLAEPTLRVLSGKDRVRLLAPYAAVTLPYLLFRLFALPLNRQYAPIWRLDLVLTPALVIAASLAAPVAIWVTFVSLGRPASLARVLRGLGSRWPYLPFLAVATLPCLGHYFFSPGWLLYPGFFWLLAATAAVEIPLPEGRRLALATAALALLLVAPVVFYLNRLAWPQWQTGQRELHRVVAELPDDVEHMSIFFCNNPRYPDESFERVVGHWDSLVSLWALHHKRPIVFEFRPCREIEGWLAVPQPHRVALRWSFPRLERLGRTQ